MRVTQLSVKDCLPSPFPLFFDLLALGFSAQTEILSLRSCTFSNREIVSFNFLVLLDVDTFEESM